MTIRFVIILLQIFVLNTHWYRCTLTGSELHMYGRHQQVNAVCYIMSLPDTQCWLRLSVCAAGSLWSLWSSLQLHISRQFVLQTVYSVYKPHVGTLSMPESSIRDRLTTWIHDSNIHTTTSDAPVSDSTITLSNHGTGKQQPNAKWPLDSIKLREKCW